MLIYYFLASFPQKLSGFAPWLIPPRNTDLKINNCHCGLYSRNYC